MTSSIRPNRFLILLFSFFFLITGCDANEPTTDAQANNKQLSKVEQSTKNSPTVETKKSGEKMSSNPKIKLETSKGTMILELDAEKAPKSSENFVKYVNDGFYDGLIFHRVIPNFMVQGGGMNPDMSEKGNKTPIQNEANNGLKNDRGTIAMARTNDPHSATSQFFINLKDNDFLNHTSETPAGWGYAVFGKVTAGMDVVNKIKEVKTTVKAGHQDVPAEDVIIESAELVES